MTVTPVLRALYLLAIGLGVFLLPGLGWVTVALALQVVLWLALGLGGRALLRQLRKLWFFAALILLSYAFTSQDPALDQWVDWQGLRVNATGALAGLAMVVRIAAVVLASQVARAGDPTALAAGLGGIGVPRTAALSVDAVLALLGGGGPGSGGGGGGGGGGRGRRGEPEAGEPGEERLWPALKRVARGDVGPIAQRLERQIERAQDYVARQQGSAGDAAADVGVVAGVALAMLGMRALKVLPSIPFAPGHKLVVLTPLYIAASLLTRSRFGSTLTGTSMGTVSFLMGEGRYGVFEIAKHVAPGLICDAGVPLLTAGESARGPWVWSLFGGVIGAGRFFTVLAVVWLVQAPAVAYAILLPGLTVHVVFGILSGYVTYHLVNHLLKRTPRSDVDGVYREVAP